MPNSPISVDPRVSTELDRLALGHELLRQGARELARLRMVRGAHRRTAQRIRRALTVVALAASLLGIPLAATAAPTPVFANPFPFGLASVGANATPALADIDGDGDLDLVAGPSGTTFFENTGTASAPAFGAPTANPFLLTSGGSRAFADIDGDGDFDMLTRGTFFENTGTASAPAFQAMAPNPLALGDVGLYTAPAFADIDGDGDFDALIGNGYGETIFFENTGTASAPAFAAAVTHPFGLADVGIRAAPAFADIDGDGDFDALIGNGYGETIFFENTGTAAAPAFAAFAMSPFGLENASANAAPAFADIDGDGDLDAFIGNLYGHVLFFENSGSASAPSFASPNRLGLADVGTLAVPGLADIDGDGDLDALIGSFFNTVFFENTGTTSGPAFGAPATNPFGLPAVDYFLSPVFADIDGDGDLDAFIGSLSGNTIFGENTGTASSPAFDTFVTNPFGLGDLGECSSPAFADIDGDGDLDGLFGNNYGDVAFFENTGTSSAPEFALPVTNPFDLLNVGFLAKPAFVDIDGDGDLDAFIGERYGDTIFFENTGTTSAAAFASPVTNPFGLIDVGYRAAPAFADIDGDGDLDALVGDISGHTFFFENFPALDGASRTVGAGGAVTTDTEADGATAADAVETTVTTPDAGTIEIREGDVTTPNPGGFTLFGQQVSIDAPTATAEDPLVIVFELDESILPPGEDETTIAVFRDGAAVGACAGTPGEADPDPCVSSRVLQGDGDVELTVLTSQASEWNFGASGEEPVDGCPAAPDPGCVTGFEKGSLLVNEKKAGKEKLVVKLVKGPAIAQSDFGNPLISGGTVYQLCLYDGGNELVGELEVDRAGETCGTKPCWKTIGSAPPAGKGFAYKDKALEADGVQAVSFKAGEAGKPKVVVTGKNNAAKGQTSLPVGIAAGLASAESVTVQVQTSDAECFSATLADVVKQDATQFTVK